MFRPESSLIGMVHVGALPGTPAAAEPIDVLARRAADEARLLAGLGVDAVMVENMHDRPYVTRVGPEIVAGMTAIGVAVRAAVDVPVGVQILAAGHIEALAVAAACGADFVRVENFVFAQVADEGLMSSAVAGELLRYRRAIGATHIAVWADVKKKHASHALTADTTLADTARAAEFFGADAIIVTGAATGRPASIGDVRAAREAVQIPVLVGSGVTPDNLDALWPFAHGFIVGSYLKRDGLWSNPPDPKRVERLVSAVASRRAASAA